VKVLTLVLLALASTAAPAAAAPMSDSSQLWATVNACDTAARPDAIGIRASMPGSGEREALLMRFRVQYLDPADGRWRFIAEGADSGLLTVGVARTRRLESGYDFRFAPPEGGGAFTLRGHVTFVWRRGVRVVRRASELTEPGHRSTKGADPPGYSAAVCRIS
jgi:hypothetical protein